MTQTSYKCPTCRTPLSAPVQSQENLCAPCSDLLKELRVLSLLELQKSLRALSPNERGFEVSFYLHLREYLRRELPMPSATA
jgi:hypothetical protein